jgi:prevent-host-death family protein
MEISIAEAQKRLAHWINQASRGPVTITRRGKPVGVIIAPEEHERLKQLEAYIKMLSLSQDLRDSGVTADELYRDSRHELGDKA